DIESYPMNWPIGMGHGLEGIYDIYHQRVELYHPEQFDGQRFIPLTEDKTIPKEHPLNQNSLYQQALEDVELLQEAGDSFDREKVSCGDQTPVFFGSALTNFGVQTFLETFLEFAPAPHAHKTIEEEKVSPYEENFSGFVFKIQANMNPAHRDRIAFVRICSGTFERGMDVTLERNQKKMRLSNVTQFMADTRENIQEA